jgi:hypothetical protein
MSTYYELYNVGRVGDKQLWNLQLWSAARLDIFIYGDLTNRSIDFERLAWDDYY